ncbi:phage shock protein A (PspA) family protein [Raineyella antarctica]|uniref:Phage shock protein A (PspA) family protein n=1 Tax=Raineyella antarctica TaxID=1577474 RepID=A0A1G6GDR0_9ACTN|nr:phage shock protein A (PspA) family protein [Raineyella antarctica]
MSGIFQRISTIFNTKANKALDRMEDPRETLDYSYERQLELLRKVRRGVADVATSRKRVELQANQLNQQVDKLDQQARRALEIGREDLAREALTRKSGVTTQLSDLQTQHAQLQQEEEKLVRASQRLQSKVDAFRTKKETIKATYSAAEAQTRISEAFSGIGEEMGDVGLAIQRAEDKTLQMQARAGAVDELLASGALDDPTGMVQDDITRELDQLASTSQVENELAAMKQQLSLGASPAGQAQQAIGGAPQAQPAIGGAPQYNQGQTQAQAQASQQPEAEPVDAEVFEQAEGQQSYTSSPQPMQPFGQPTPTSPTNRQQEAQ